MRSMHLSLPLFLARNCIRLSLFLIVLFNAAGCTPAFRPEPMLGIMADQDLQVIAIEPNSPALKAGVQEGDILIDLTWDSFSNNVSRNRNGIEMAPIPFSDRERIRTLMDFEYTLTLRVKRANQTIELAIQPDVPIWRKYSDPTPTPIPIRHYVY